MQLTSRNGQQCHPLQSCREASGFHRTNSPRLCRGLTGSRPKPSPFSGYLAIEVADQARFEPETRLGVEDEMGAEFSEGFPIVVEGLHRGQTPSHPDHTERPARLPAGLVVTLGVEP